MPTAPLTILAIDDREKPFSLLQKGAAQFADCDIRTRHAVDLSAAASLIVQQDSQVIFLAGGLLASPAALSTLLHPRSLRPRPLAIVVLDSEDQHPRAALLANGAADCLLRSSFSLADVDKALGYARQVVEFRAGIHGLIDDANDLFYTHDLNGAITDLNRTAEGLTGYSRSELLGRDMTELLTPESLLAAQHALRTKREGKADTTTYEVELVRKDGSSVPMEVSTRIVRFHGVPVGIQGTGRDISRRKELERQLIHAEKLEALGRLAGGLAHDFNNLLTAISGFADLIRAEIEEDSPLVSTVAAMRKTCTSAEQLVHRLLRLSREQTPELIRTSPNAVLVEMQPTLNQLLESTASLSLKLEPTLGQVMADSVAFEQLMLNLVINARDAMPEGGNITVETHNVSISSNTRAQFSTIRPGEYVSLHVADTGVGIAPELLGKIFEPLFSTKSAGKGTGLGLSIVYSALEQIQAHMLVHSEVGAGTVFEVLIPRCQGEHIPALATQDAGMPSTPSTNEGESAKILVVEDDDNVRFLISELLELNGYDVLTASGGQHALDVAREHPDEFDLVLTDVLMPELDGRQLADCLLTQWPQLKVLFMSGYTESLIVQKNVLASDSAFLAKPFSEAELINKIREILDPDLKSSAATAGAV